MSQVTTYTSCWSKPLSMPIIRTQACPQNQIAPKKETASLKIHAPKIGVRIQAPHHIPEQCETLHTRPEGSIQVCTRQTIRACLSCKLHDNPMIIDWHQLSFMTSKNSSLKLPPNPSHLFILVLLHKLSTIEQHRSLLYDNPQLCDDFCTQPVDE